MARARTYYEILGVSRSASQADIRAAYVRMMKRYHPDSSQRDPDEPDFAAILNRCYATLKDPAERSRYDAGLASGQTSVRGKVRPAASTYYHAPQRPLRRSGPALVGAIFTGMIALALWAPSIDSNDELFASALGWPSAGDAAGTMTAGTALPGRSDIRSIADQARGSTTAEAEHYSRRCFADARSSASAEAIDRCVLFDLAYLYWRPGNNSADTPPYFASQVVSYRHQDALSAYGARADTRLAQLRESAFAGLIEGLRGDQYDSQPSPRFSPD